MICDWCVFKFLWGKVDEKYLKYFQSETCAFNLFDVVWTEHIVLSPYYVWHWWEFIFCFFFTILLQFTTQEVREKTIKEQGNLYNSEMLRYDQYRISPHNVNAMLSVKLARKKRIVNYKTLSWCTAEFSERMLKKWMEVSKETWLLSSITVVWVILPRTKLPSNWRKPGNSR